MTNYGDSNTTYFEIRFSYTYIYVTVYYMTARSSYDLE